MLGLAGWLDPPGLWGPWWRALEAIAGTEPVPWKYGVPPGLWFADVSASRY